MEHHTEILLENPVDETEALESIQEQIKENSLLVYMKGNAALPQCGFSAQVIEIFNKLGAKYKTFNILNHYPIREGIKKFSNWPTIPQIYYKGKFLGGCDIIIEMYQNGELARLLEVE